MRVAVIGAGIAGLCAAFRMRERHDVSVFEAQSQAGGKVHSQHIDGYVFEWGPNGFLSSATELLDIVRDLGLDSEVVAADETASKRYIFWNGKLHALPSKPQQALTTSLISPLGKVRAMRELLAKPAEPPADETVDAFFTRHFGAEVARRIAAPALLGISGGDSRQTSLAALFPRLPAMERDHGSVLRAMVRSGGTRTKMLGFGAAGLQRLTTALCDALGDRVRLRSPVDTIARDAQGWSLGGERFDAIVVTVPAHAAAQMLDSCDPVLAGLLKRIPYAAMRVAGIAFRAADVPVALDGFGFLAARESGVRILGAVYTSTMFPDQAPTGTAYLRIFLGGSDDEAIANVPEPVLLGIVRRDLQTTLRITAAPLAFHDYLWRQGIPQYRPGHEALVAQIEERARAHGGLVLTGNAYHGLGIGDTARNAVAAVARLDG
jgi:oxygen-dependent protoporphyrinogen oxidase